MTISRVNYFDRQFLRPQDFSDEQAYHVAMHRRHNIAGHIWGIVYGLEVVKDPQGNLAIQPGFAVDGYGRELVLPYPQPISTKVFEENGSERLEIWLKYARLESDFATGGYAGCAVESGASTRSQELAVVELQPPDPNLLIESDPQLPERRQPAEVPANDLRFRPTQVPPDDPIRTWPVYLGLIRRTPGSPPEVTVDLGGRPYAGLVGEMVRAPSGRAWMQVGSELEDDPYRFAVYLEELEAHLRNTSVDLLPRLGVTTDGRIDLRGDTTLDGNLTVDGGGIEFGAGPALALPRPWRIYHVEGPTDPGNSGSPTVHQLRIEMEAPPRGLVGNNQVSIGVWSAQQNSFQPCLTVDDNCVVTVHGNLHVEGVLEATSPLGQPPLSPEARSNITGIMMMSLTQRLSTLAAGPITPPGAVGAVIPADPEAPVAADVRPQLDNAMKEIIRVLHDNGLESRFRALWAEESPAGEVMTETAAPSSVIEPSPETQEPAVEPAEPPIEPTPPKPKRRSRKKKSE